MAERPGSAGRGGDVRRVRAGLPPAGSSQSRDSRARFPEETEA